MVLSFFKLDILIEGKNLSGINQLIFSDHKNIFELEQILLKIVPMPAIISRLPGRGQLVSSVIRIIRMRIIFSFHKV